MMQSILFYCGLSYALVAGFIIIVQGPTKGISTTNKLTRRSAAWLLNLLASAIKALAKAIR